MASSNHSVDALLDSLPLPEKYLIRTNHSSDEDTLSPEDDVKPCPFERERRRMFAQPPLVGSLRSRHPPQETQRPTAHVSPSVPPKISTTANQWTVTKPPPFHAVSSKRWNSASNIHLDDTTGEFNALRDELDATSDASRFFNEAEDVDCYKNIALSVDPASLRKSSHSVTDITAKKTDSDMYSSYGASYRTPLTHSFPATNPIDSLYSSALPTSSYVPHRQFSATLPPSYSTSDFSDLTQWQQQHQEQLRRQRIETNPAHYSTMSSHSSFSSDPRRLDAVKHAADNIIREKDTIIDKQKYRIKELEKQSTSEVLDMLQQEKQTLAARVQDTNEDQNKDLLIDNSTLRTRISDNQSFKHNNFEKKLGAAENELRELRKSTDSELNSRRLEIQKLKEQLQDKDSELQKVESRLEERKKQADRLQLQLEGQQRYLQDIPTPDEHSKGQQMAKDMKEECQRLKAQVAMLEKKLTDTSKGRHSRDSLIETLERANREQTQQIQSLQKQNQLLQKALCGEDILKPDEREELEELRTKHAKLSSDFEKAKKLLESQHKKMQLLEVKHQSKEAELKEQVQREVSEVIALRQQCATDEQNKTKLRASLKQMSSRYQDQMESNLALKEKMQEVQEQFSSECLKLQKRLFTEMEVCFAELQALVQVCVQQANGQEPNVSALLCAKGHSEQAAEASLQISAQSLRYKLTQVKEFRSEVDKLRSLISNMYAEQMGENLTCVTH